MINGLKYDWESIQVMLPSGIAVGIQSIDYEDERPIKARYGKGSKPRGYGRGNYGAKAKMELDLDEAEILQAALGASYYNSRPFPIIVAYANEDQITVIDTLPACKITKVSTAAKQGDDNVGGRKFDLEILAPIMWGDVGALGALVGAVTGA